MNIEDAITTKEVASKRKWDEGTSHNPVRKKEARSIGHAKNRKKNLLSRRSKFTNFSPLVISIEQVLMLIKDELSLQWPRPIYALAEVGVNNRCCKFHQDHEHCIDECRHLKDQVETLIRQWKLQKLVRKTEPYKR